MWALIKLPEVSSHYFCILPRECVCVRACKRVWFSMSECVGLSLCVCMYVCVYVCMYVGWVYVSVRYHVCMFGMGGCTYVVCVCACARACLCESVLSINAFTGVMGSACVNVPHGAGAGRMSECNSHVCVCVCVCVCLCVCLCVCACVC